MNWQPIVGLLLLLYGAFCIFVGVTKKPAGIWEMKKIQTFIKVLGEKGTVIFFVIWGLAAACLGAWMFTL